MSGKMNIGDNTNDREMENGMRSKVIHFDESGQFAMDSGKTENDIRDIDWNEVCREIRNKKTYPSGNAEYWDKRAPSFARNASKSDYISKFFNLVELKREWSVLDVGCAAGTLAIPLASKVKMITGMDISKKMLALLQERAAQAGINNIKTVCGRWEDNWERLGIVEHDVAIASRSLITLDFRSALEKLNKAARKRVYISTIVGDGPLDRRIFDALGRELNAGPDYIYIYNLLYHMGINASVDFITYRERNSYESPDEAFNILKCRFENMSLHEENILRTYLDEHLVLKGETWEMSYRREIKWAVIWWRK
jgi:SAM-dependent methyltransferase